MQMEKEEFGFDEKANKAQKIDSLIDALAEGSPLDPESTNQSTQELKEFMKTLILKEVPDSSKDLHLGGVEDD
jgi:hypothetical protein